VKSANPTTGLKLKLGESIERALRRMRCPWWGLYTLHAQCSCARGDVLQLPMQSAHSLEAPGLVTQPLHLK
jgi:hypothetical protein